MLMLQIVTTFQLAIGMVHYAYWPLKPAFFDAVSKAYGTAEDAAAIEAFVEDPALTACDWEDLKAYVKAAEADMYGWGEYRPLSRHTVSGGSVDEPSLGPALS